MAKKLKKYFLIIILNFILMFNFFTQNINASQKQIIINNISMLKQMENQDISQVEKEIQEVQSKFKSSKELKLNYKEIFKNTVFIGDSQTEGLKVYNILNSTSVLAKKGSNLVDARNYIDSLSNLNPSTTFLLYGMNDILIYKNDINSFIQDYSYLIKEIKSTIPDTSIVVNAVLPVMNNVIENRSVYINIDKYNESLSIMCEALGVEFIDASYLLEEDNKLFEGDGMHLKPNFYIKWLSLLRKEVSL